MRLLHRSEEEGAGVGEDVHHLPHESKTPLDEVVVDLNVEDQSTEANGVVRLLELLQVTSLVWIHMALSSQSLDIFLDILLVLADLKES